MSDSQTIVYQSQVIHSATRPPVTVREPLQVWTLSRTAVWEMESHTMMAVDVECAMVSIIMQLLSNIHYNNDTAT